MMDAYISATGANAMADRDVCIAVGQDLEKHYPGHPWAVGCDHMAGTVVIDLAYPKPLHLRGWQMMIHLPRLFAPNGHREVVRAGGELLERFGLERGKAAGDSAAAAQEHGLDADAAVLRSTGSKL